MRKATKKKKHTKYWESCDLNLDLNSLPPLFFCWTVHLCNVLCLLSEWIEYVLLKQGYISAVFVSRFGWLGHSEVQRIELFKIFDHVTLLRNVQIKFWKV